MDNDPKDALTGLLTRETLWTKIDEYIGTDTQTNGDLSFLILDLDYFKSINDVFGHRRGDEVLVEFAHHLQATVRQSDFVFRYGGDEFVVLLPNTNKESAKIVARNILERTQSMKFAGSPPLDLTLSIGIASFPVDAPSRETLFEVADQRQYQAKRSGRNCMVSENAIPITEANVENLSRIIERDKANQIAHQFLEEYDTFERGILKISGIGGSGKTRYLNELEKLAQLRGYTFISIQCSPGLKLRPYGALLQALYKRYPSFALDENPAMIKIEWLDRLKGDGDKRLIVLIDDFHELDRSSVSFIKEQFSLTDFPSFAVIYTTSGSVFEVDRLGYELVEKTIKLYPFSASGTRVWVRHSLQWDPPEHFITWLQEATSGLPAALEKSAAHLIEQNILMFRDEGWTTSRRIESYPLADWLLHASFDTPNNLPSNLEEIFGRALEIQNVISSLEENQLILLLAPGGFGKSRLSLQIAVESLQNFPDGVYWIPLVDVTDDELLPLVIAEAIEIPLEGSQNPEKQLQNYLKSRQMLLVLDNFEHLRSQAWVVSLIMDFAPAVKILVTSRERLDIPGEAVIELDGLQFPPSGIDHHAENYSAVQLFLHLAQQMRKFDSPLGEHHKDIARICQLVTGIPLGIALAASWAQTLSVDEIASNIEKNLSFLETNQPDIPARHRSLLAMVDSFWNLLLEPEHRVIRKLSVFRGGFRENAARVIAGASPFFLDALVAKFFLDKTPDGRFEIHELLRQYAKNKLEEYPKEEGRTRTAHCDYYLSFLSTKTTQIRKDQKTRQEIKKEFENIRSAWLWAAANGESGKIDAALDGISQYYYLSGLYEEALHSFQICVEHLEGKRDKQSIGASLTAAEEWQSESVLAKLWIEQSRFLNGQGKFHKAIEAIQRGLNLFPSPDTVSATANAELQWGYALWQLDQFDEALPHIEKALQLAQHFNNPRVEANALRVTGNVHTYNDNFKEGAENFHQALARYRNFGDEWEEGLTLNNLGYLAMEQNNPVTAATYLKQALVIHQKLGNIFGEGVTANNLGRVLLGDYDASISYCLRALHIYRQLGNHRGEGVALSNLGMIYDDLEEYHIALDYYKKSEDVMQNAPNPGYKVLGEILRWRVLLNMEDFETARKIGTEAVTLARKIEPHHTLCAGLECLARLALKTGDLALAKTCNEEILDKIEKQPIKYTRRPFIIYLTVYRILAATQDERAGSFLQNIYQMLQDQAIDLTGEAKKAFLENIPAHRAIMQAYDQAHH